MSRLDLRTGRSGNNRPRGTPRRGGGGGRGGANPSASPSPGASPEAQDPQAALAAFAQAQGFGGNFAQSNVVPTPPVGEQYRFYWNTPLVMSPHNPRVLYVGGD